MWVCGFMNSTITQSKAGGYEYYELETLIHPYKSSLIYVVRREGTP